MQQRILQRRILTLWAVSIGLACVSVGSTTLAQDQKGADKTIEFPSEDGLTITADLYFADENDKGLPFICLFHQAGFSRGEYQEIAPRLVELGYNCMAVDARSGKAVNKVVNETAKRAAAGKKGQKYMHALPDLVAALHHAKDNYAQGQLIAWGSSYSAALVLKASAENESLVDGSLSFSANEVAEWTREWIFEDAKTVKHPVFMTSAKGEKKKWERLQEEIPESQLTAFIPATSGRHGSRALWQSQRDSPAYWEAVEEFLTTNFPPTPTPQETAAAPSEGARPARPARPAAVAAGSGEEEKKPSMLSRLFGGGSSDAKKEEAKEEAKVEAPPKPERPKDRFGHPVPGSKPEPPKDKHGHPKPPSP